jgi:hypothetical protein
MKSKSLLYINKWLGTAIVSVLLLSLSLNAFSQSQKDVIGEWQSTESDLFQVEIFLAKNGNYYGKVIKDVKSPSNIGKLVLNNFSYQSSDNTYTGFLIPPGSDISANAIIAFESKDKLKITMRKFIFTKTLTLVRI